MTENPYPHFHRPMVCSACVYDEGYNAAIQDVLKVYEIKNSKDAQMRVLSLRKEAFHD